MAINTAEKRFSMMSFGDGSNLPLLFQKDGTVDRDDKQHLLGCYSGLSFGIRRKRHNLSVTDLKLQVLTQQTSAPDGLSVTDLELLFWGDALDAEGNLSNSLKATEGTAEAPSLTFAHDLDTGIYNSDADEVAITTNGSQKVVINRLGNVGINEKVPDYKLDINGTLGFTPGTSVAPVDIGDVVFELTNNTTLTIKAKGTDGVVRTVALTLS